MSPDQHVVTQIPLPDLWNDRGRVQAARGARLGEADVARLISEVGATFVVAEVGRSLFWVPGHERFLFWKREAKGRVVKAEQEQAKPEDFPGAYCYLASEWKLESGGVLIVLERRP
jgi:hypothetical protein